MLFTMKKSVQKQYRSNATSTRSIMTIIVGVAVAFLPGCSSNIRHGTIAIIHDQDMPRPESSIGVDSQSLPVEYVWSAGLRFIGASLHDTNDGLVLKGRIRARVPSMISASKVVKVEGLDADQVIVWSASARIDHKHGVRRSRGKSGTFELKVPDLKEIDHFHIGVIARCNKDSKLLDAHPGDVNS